MTNAPPPPPAGAPDLRKVLIDVRHALEDCNARPSGGISDTLWMPGPGAETIFDHIDAALADSPYDLLPQPQADADYMLLESVEANGIEWGVSFNGPNPHAEDYIACNSKDDALRLFDKLSAAPVSALPHQREGSIGDDKQFLDLMERRWLADNMRNVEIADRALIDHIDARLARTAPSSISKDIAEDEKDALVELRRGVESGACDEWLLDFIRQYPFAARTAAPSDLAEWERLKDPAVLHASLLQGKPARLTPDQLRHIAGDFASPLEAKPVPTDMSERLREMALEGFPVFNRIDVISILRQAADEIDRLDGKVNHYYSRMQEWKKAAEECARHPRKTQRDNIISKELAKKGQP